MSTRTITIRDTPPARRRDVNKLPWGSPAVYFIALVIIALMLGPVLYIIIGGFRSNSEITVDPSGLPVSWNPQNYVEVPTSGLFWNEVLNSTIVALATTAGAVALGLMASYV